MSKAPTVDLKKGTVTTSDAQDDEGYAPDTEEGKGEAKEAMVGEHFHIHTVDEIIGASDDPPPAIIDGALCEKGLMTISGRAKSFKTWHALQSCLSITLGKEWDGHAVKQSATVYVNLELTKESLNYRTKKIATHLGFKDLRDLEGWFLPLTINCSELMMAARKLSGEGSKHDSVYTYLLMEQIIRGIEKSKMENPKFVCLDSFYKMVGGLNENAAEDVTSVYRYVRRLMDDLNCAAEIVHHFSKGSPGDKMEGDRAAGSRVHRQEPNTYIEMVPLKEPEDTVGVHIEQRDYKAIKDYALRWNFPLMEIDTEADPRDLKTPPGSKPASKNFSTKRLTDLLNDDPLSPEEWQKAAKHAFNMGRSSFFNYRALAEEQGKVTLVDGFWWKTSLLEEAKKKDKNHPHEKSQ